jgi:BTB/POZ domain
MLYCIHQYFLYRDSEYFATRFAQLGAVDHEALPSIIPLEDIECRDFEAFLSVLYPE